MMAKFRKKPVEIEAVQFTGGNYDEVKAFGGSAVCGVDGIGFLDHDPKFDKAKLIFFSVFTLDGTMDLFKGNWLVRGVKGEFYPVRADIFEATYDRID